MKSDNVLIKELYLDMMADVNRGLKVSGPFVETLCVF